MSNNDSELIWEAYAKSLEEGWGKNLAMLGMGALAAHGALKNNSHKNPEAPSKPTQSHTQTSLNTPSMKSHMNDMNYMKAVGKTIKQSKWTEKYYVPVSNSGEPLLDLNSLNKLRKQFNKSQISQQQYRAASNQ